MRLIDADAANVHEIPVNFDYIEPGDIQEWIDEQPAVDPVHAAGGCYCRECTKRNTKRCPIISVQWGTLTQPERHHTLMPEDGYCSYGERREGDQMVNIKRLIKALRLNRLSCGIKKPCSDCELMEDCLYYQQNGAKEAADTIEHLEAENAALREQLADQAKALSDLQGQFDIINNFEQSQCAALLLKISERDKALTRVTAERNAAMEDCSGMCITCAFVHDCAKHDNNDAGPSIWHCDCEDWQWRGLQKEDGGNDE